MPYFTIYDLPEPLQLHLPKHAQEIYRRAFNKIWDYFWDEAALPINETRVSLAAKIAWLAVKEEYEKRGKRWVRKKGRTTKLYPPKKKSKFHKKKKLPPHE